MNSYKGILSFTNSTDVALVRTGYERAISLGVSVATNELARFKRRLAAEQAKAKEDADNEARVAAIKAKNSEIAQVRQAKLGRTNSGRSYIVKKSTCD